MGINICRPALVSCANLEDSCGMICVNCNCCGRINGETMLQSQLIHYKRQLQEQYDFDVWIEGFEENQRKNIAKNIEYYNEKIAEVELLIKNEMVVHGEVSKESKPDARTS